MNLETLAPYLAGPGAGLLICVLVGVGTYKFMASNVMPLVQNFVDRHLQQIDDMQARWDASDAKRESQHERIITLCTEIKTEVTSPGIANGRAK